MQESTKAGIVLSHVWLIACIGAYRGLNAALSESEGSAGLSVSVACTVADCLQSNQSIKCQHSGAPNDQHPFRAYRLETATAPSTKNRPVAFVWFPSCVCDVFVLFSLQPFSPDTLSPSCRHGQRGGPPGAPPSSSPPMRTCPTRPKIPRIAGTTLHLRRQ